MAQIRQTSAAIIVEFKPKDDIRETNAGIIVEYKSKDDIRETSAGIIVEYVSAMAEVTNAAEIVEYENPQNIEVTNVAEMIEYNFSVELSAVQSTSHTHTASNTDVYMVPFVLEISPYPLLLEDGEPLLDEEGNPLFSEGIGGSIHLHTSDNIILENKIRTSAVGISVEWVENPATRTSAAGINVEWVENPATRTTSAGIMIEWINIYLNVQNTAHVVTSDNIEFITALTVQSSSHDTQTREYVVGGGITYILLSSYFGGRAFPILYFPYVYRDLTHLVLIFHPEVPWTINNSTHIVTSDKIDIIYYPLITLSANNSTHIVTSDNITLSTLPPPFYLFPDFTSHKVISTHITLTAHTPGVLNVQNSSHIVTSDNIVLGVAKPDNSSHVVTSENITLTYYPNILHAAHIVTSTTINLSQNYILPSVHNSVIYVTSTVIVMYPVRIANYFGWKKIPMGIGIDGPDIR